MNIAQVRRHALSLAEVTEEPHHHFSSFRVGGKIFVTVPPEETHIHIFVSEDQRELALSLEPECLEKLLWGGKVVGLRVDLAKAPGAVVKRMVSQAWGYKAPKALKVALARKTRLDGS
jgi:hypothetical protein